MIGHNKRERYAKNEGAPTTIKPFLFPRIWHVRFIVASVLIAMTILALFAVPYSGFVTIPEILSIDLVAASIAGFTILIAPFTLIRYPKSGSVVRPYIVYLPLVILSGWLVVASGGNMASPFVALWVMVAIFSGVFSMLGTVPILIAVFAYAAIGMIERSASIESLVFIGFAGLMPVILSAIIWHNLGEPPDDDLPERLRKQVIHSGDESVREDVIDKINESSPIINAIGDGVIAIDGQGIVKLINHAAKELLGWTGNDALTLHYKSVLSLIDEHGNDIPEAGNPIFSALNSNQETRKNRLTVLTRNNKRILTSLVASPVGEPGNGVIIVFRDITQDTLEERQKAEFISTASHEMRTPVASIEGYLGLALNPQTATIDAKARDYIEKAHQSAQHLGRLFQDLLDVSKAEDGRLTNNPRVVNVVEFAEAIVQGLRQKASEKGLELVYKPGVAGKAGERQVSPVYYVNLDNDHIREIINNLVENAIKYTPKGTVSIDVTSENDRVVIAISDSGIGIPAEDIPHLFQKFYRVDNSDTREIGGTGLGLYLCRRLAEAMGGRVWVKSQYKQGSTFFLELPRVETQEARELLEQQEIDDKKAQNAEILAATTPQTTPTVTRETQQQPPIRQPQGIPQLFSRENAVNTPLTAIEQNRDTYARQYSSGQTYQRPPQ